MLRGFHLSKKITGIISMRGYVSLDINFISYTIVDVLVIVVLCCES
jgi:hypothetical protein